MFLHTVLALLAIYLAILWWKSKRLPPGPWCLPIVGYLPWLDAKAPYKSLHDLAKKYGPVYGLYMGNIYTVVLSDAKLIKKVLSKDITTGRAPLYLTHGLMKGYGLICAEGELWKDQRRFVFSYLKQFGGTKMSQNRNTMENLIIKHADEFLDYVSTLECPATLSPSEHLRHSLGSFMNTIVFGECWDKDDETWKYLQHLQEEGIKYIGIAGPLNFIPILRFLPMYQKTVRFLTQGLQTTHKIYDEIIEKHQELLRNALSDNPNYEITNFLEAFLIEREKKKHSSEFKLYHDQQLRYLLADIFGAGLDTTLTTLNWYILFMCTHRDIQKRIHEELSSVLQNKRPTMTDFQYLPLFEASIAETQRIRSTVPIGIPHGSLGDFEIDQYSIPSNSMIVPLQWAVHMDGEIWKDPETFNPNRFLDADGRLFKPEGFIPFQLGKRMCVGEELAKMLLYIFSSSILQKYELVLDDDSNINLNGNCGITLTPNEYDITFIEYQ